jgi:hypothetical protein
MLDKPISPLRQRMIDDMTARRFSEKVQKAYVLQDHGGTLRADHNGGSVRVPYRVLPVRAAVLGRPWRPPCSHGCAPPWRRSYHTVRLTRAALAFVGMCIAVVVLTRTAPATMEAAAGALTPPGGPRLSG